MTETILKRDRAVVMAGLASIITLAWAYMFFLAGSMAGDMSGNMKSMELGMEMVMPSLQTWGVTDFVFMFIMWSVMMVAMMTPSAAPMVLIFSKFNRQQREQHAPFLRTGIFLSGYLIVWAGYSVLATLVQWGLHSMALLSPMMVSTSPVLGGVLLIGAGIFQFTPLKHACLSHCRTPLGFLMNEWQEGNRGALRMGLQHGNFCVGCCWLIMTLLFVAGVMNLLWVATITAYVLFEKIIPQGYWVSRAIGLLIIVWGTWIIIGAFYS
jgi:predicted metal-binding membrane protein